MRDHDGTEREQHDEEELAADRRARREEWSAPWRCDDCGHGYPCPCRVDVGEALCPTNNCGAGSQSA